MFGPTSAVKHKNNSVEIRSKELTKCETSASVVLRITIATGEARANEKTPKKTSAIVCLMEGRFFFFAMKPNEMGMQYFQGLQVL